VAVETAATSVTVSDAAEGTSEDVVRLQAEVAAYREQLQQAYDELQRAYDQIQALSQVDTYDSHSSDDHRDGESHDRDGESEERREFEQGAPALARSSHDD
jgi:hypothetical protein